MRQRILSLFLALALLCSLLPQMGLTAHASSFSGACGAESNGSNLTWTFDEDTGLLTIEGSGKMADYDRENGAPWNAYAEAISAASLPEGMTSIGDFAFYGCSSLTSVTIPDSVTSIAVHAFGDGSTAEGSEAESAVAFTVRGMEGSAAQACAEENGFTFVPLASSPAILQQPESTSVVLGETATFTVVASGDNLSYQWQYQKVGDADWTPWTGKTSASLSVKASSTNNGCMYRCVVSNTAGSVTSNAATLNGGSTGSKPSITSQPTSVSVGLGQTASFSVVASGENLSYKWQYKKPGSSTWVTWSGKTAATVSVKASSVNTGFQYRCIVSNDAGSVTSNAATLNGGSTGSKPSITSQPTSVSVGLGQTASFSVVASGENLSYKWQYKKPGSSAWVTWSGKTAATVSVKASNANNGYQYRCVVSNDTGSVSSEAATLHVIN